VLKDFELDIELPPTNITSTSSLWQYSFQTTLRPMQPSESRACSSAHLSRLHRSVLDVLDWHPLGIFM